MVEPQPASGNILVYAKVRNPEAKSQLAQLLEELPGERISSNLYEVFTADWDEGLWEEEVERMQTLVDPDFDTLIFWQASGDRLLRPCISGRTS